jgi:hypothetical protein
MSSTRLAVALFALNVLAFSGPLFAAERSEEDFVKACTANSNLSPAVCECSAKKAKAELTPDGYSLLVATLEGNDSAAAQLRSKLPVEQVMKAGTFMTRPPAQCAKESPAAD